MTAARRTCSRSSVCFAEKLSVPKLKWLYARRQFAPQVPAMRVSLVVSFSYLFHHIYTYTDTHTGVLIHTHIRTHARTHIHTLGASAALPQCPFLAKHLVQTRKALTDFSKILQALPKVWLPKTHSYSSSSSSSSGSGSNSSFRHSL